MQVSPPVRFGVLTLVGVLAIGLLWLGINRYQAEQRTVEAAKVPAVTERASTTKAAPAAAEPVAVKPVEQPKLLYVHVEGAVKNPGVYRLEEGARVADAIAMAGGAVLEGGPSVEGDPSVLNLAERVVDGGKVFVKTKAQVKGEAPPPSAAETATVKDVQSAGGGSASSAGTSGGSKAPGGKVNVNTASQAQLESLKGIGESTAKKIMAERAKKPFKDLNDLKSRGGVQPKYITELADKVSF